MRGQPVDALSILRLRIRRLVIDAGALGELPREHLLPDLQAALAERLSGATQVSARKSMGLGGAIADAVVERLGSAHLGIRDNGASR